MEKIKTALIVFLVFTMCVLSYLSVTIWSGTGWFSELFEPSRGEYIPPNGTHLNVGTVPYKISVSSGTAIHTQSRITAQNELYKDIKTLLYESIGSMEQVSAISEEDFFAIYQGQAITVENIGPIPLYLMGERGNNTEIAENNVKTLAIYKQGKAVTIGFRDEGNGRYFKSQTAASAMAFDSVTEKYKESNGIFAHVLNLNLLMQRKERFQILGNTPQVLPVYRLMGDKLLPDGQEAEQEMLQILGMNPLLAKDYQENSGTKVYVEDGGVVRFSTKNGISFVGKETGTALPVDDPYELINVGISRIGQLAGAILPENSAMTVSLAKLKEENGETTVSFYTMVDGAMVSDGKFGAGFTVSGGTISKLWLDLPELEEAGSAEILAETDGAQVAERLQTLHFTAMYGSKDGKLVPYLGYLED